MTTIYLIRHAEADGNLYRRAHGWFNSVITDRGYRQIAALAERFADTHIDAVYSSDRFRTMTTALSIYKTHGLPLRTVRRLREIDVGFWEDTAWAEIEHFDAEELALFNRDASRWHVQGSETIAEVRDRMVDALRTIAEAHPNETVAVFSHGMAMRVLVGTLQGLTLQEIDGTGHAENTAVNTITYENGKFCVLSRDDAGHLSEELQGLKRQKWVTDAKGFGGGIRYEASGEEGHFDILLGEEIVGAVSVAGCENGIAEIGEYWLDESVQGKGFGQQPIGQALSYARSRGCTTLSTGRIPKSNARGIHCARSWGFLPACETADWIEFHKEYRYNEEYCWRKLQEVMKK